MGHVETDAAGPRANDWRFLTELSAEVAARVVAELLPPRRPILITEPGLIHRYRLDGFLRALVTAHHAAFDDRIGDRAPPATAQ